MRERFGDAGVLASDLPEALAIARRRLAGVAERHKSDKKLGFRVREVAAASTPETPGSPAPETPGATPA
jgi:hypothetical protein